MGLFWGQSTPLTAEKHAKPDHTASRTLPKRIPSHDTAIKAPVVHVLGPSRGHLGPFWGHFAAEQHRIIVYGLKTGKTRVKDTPHVARVDFVPRHGHRTPPVPILQPSGPVWGRLWGIWGAELANERTAGGKHAQRVAAGPLRWLLGVPGPIRGRPEPQRGVSIFGPVLRLVACYCCLLNAQAHPTNLKST